MKVNEGEFHFVDLVPGRYTVDLIDSDMGSIQETRNHWLSSWRKELSFEPCSWTTIAGGRNFSLRVQRAAPFDCTKRHRIMAGSPWLR